MHSNTCMHYTYMHTCVRTYVLTLTVFQLLPDTITQALYPQWRRQPSATTDFQRCIRLCTGGWRYLVCCCCCRRLSIVRQWGWNGKIRNGTSTTQQVG